MAVGPRFLILLFVVLCLLFDCLSFGFFFVLVVFLYCFCLTPFSLSLFCFPFVFSALRFGVLFCSVLFSLLFSFFCFAFFLCDFVFQRVFGLLCLFCVVCGLCYANLVQGTWIRKPVPRIAPPPPARGMGGHRCAWPGTIRRGRQVSVVHLPTMSWMALGVPLSPVVCLVNVRIGTAPETPSAVLMCAQGQPQKHPSSIPHHQSPPPPPKGLLLHPPVLCMPHVSCPVPCFRQSSHRQIPPPPPLPAQGCGGPMQRPGVASPPPPQGKSGVQLRGGGGSIEPPKYWGAGLGNRAPLTGPVISCYELWRRRR